MDQEFAGQIVERYLGVLAETWHMVAGVPESRLPCDASFIKEAIKMVLAQTPEGSDLYHQLRSAYPKLATFIPDRDAEVAAKAEEAMVAMDITSDGFKYLDEHAKILKKVQDDMYLLSQELYEYLDKAVRA